MTLVTDMTFDPHALARAYTQALYRFATRKSAMCDMAFGFNPSDQNDHSREVWNRFASDCDELRDEVDDLIYETTRAA